MSALIQSLDLDVCAREPIHVPGAIQPFGHLLALRGADNVLAYGSAGAEAVLGIPLASALGQPIGSVLSLDANGTVSQGLARLPERNLAQLGEVRGRDGHRAPDGHVVLEFEHDPDDKVLSRRTTLEALYPLLRRAFDELAQAPDVQTSTAVAARQVRELTGFDRVLIYRFEESWDGVVIAEDRNERLPSYLDLRFPASDIPAQARALYSINRLRLIANVDDPPVPILADRAGQPPLDLSLSILRSISPVHLQYMRNMGTPSSMSVSLLRGDRLWGLISCHHAEPRRVPFAVRAACDLLGQMVGAQIVGREEASHAESRAYLKSIGSRLLARMAAAGGHVAEGLRGAPAELCALTGAEGAAVLTGGDCILLGRTPPEDRVRRLADLLQGRGVDEVWATQTLSDEIPDHADVADLASGLLAASISRLHPSFVLWFRPELVRTVRWAGDPRKPVDPRSVGAQLEPRHSFQVWKETVRATAAPWRSAEIEAARDLRSAIVGVVLRQAEERAELSGQLERTNSELAAFSYTVSHDLRAPFRHVVGYAELLLEREGTRFDETSRRFVSTIIESAQTAGQLVDALLNFSRMGRASLIMVRVETETLVRQVVDRLALEVGDRKVEWRIGKLPDVRADPVMLRQVFQNLLSNALKYSRGRDLAEITVEAKRAEGETVFTVGDNGAGFDMAYVHKLFGVFQRLHRVEDYEGVGIGLANVRRIVERHGGRVWAKGVLDGGAAFSFTLPDPAVLQEER